VSAKSHSESAVTLWTALGDAYAAMSAHASADAARYGFSLAELAVLNVLQRQGPMLLGELQRHVSVSSGGATFLVDRLEGKGLVKRRSCADDRRATFAALTPKGTRVLTRILPKHKTAIRKAVAGLSGKRQRAVTMLLRELADTASPRANNRRDGDKTRRSRTD
jgi:MarR family transcriptional regulator, 2-MHQ and catechol-resistance regulon repressor